MKYFCLLIVVQNVYSFENADDAILLQGFDWDALSSRSTQYAKLQSMASDIKSANFTAVWFPPPSPSVDSQGYLPQDWETLEAQDTQLAAIQSVAALEITPVVDVIVNHRTAPNKDACSNEYTAFTHPVMNNSFVVSYDAMCDDDSLYFCPDNCDCGASDSGDNFCGAPDLDHSNPALQAEVQAYQSFLLSSGYAGYRFDMVKGYAAQYATNYIQADADIKFAVGEYFDADLSAVTAWVEHSAIPAFDFPLRYTLQNAVNNDDYSALADLSSVGLAGLHPKQAVTFIDNHDTARDDRFGDSDALAMAYAFIISLPGVPSIFWTDFIDSSLGNTIIKLIAVRRTANIFADATLVVVDAQPCLFSAYLDSSLAIKLGSCDWSPSSSSFSLAISGNNFAIWLQDITEIDASLRSSLA